MATISNAAGLMNPAHYAQEVSLSVLMGQPLALTRAVIALETAGGVLPVSQADTSVNARLLAGRAGRKVSILRTASRRARLHSTPSRFPVRLGNLADIDDGLVGFFIDGQGTRESVQHLLRPQRPGKECQDIARPGPDTITLTLNATPIALTFLMDPRAPIHATTGILPVETLAIPSDQYADHGPSGVDLLHTSSAHRARRPDRAAPARGRIRLELGAARAACADAAAAQCRQRSGHYNYTPQHLFEGWARLVKAPEPPRRVGEAPTRNGGSDVTGMYSTDPLTSASQCRVGSDQHRGDRCRREPAAHLCGSHRHAQSHADQCRRVDSAEHWDIDRCSHLPAPLRHPGRSAGDVNRRAVVDVRGRAR